MTSDDKNRRRYKVRIKDNQKTGEDEMGFEDKEEKEDKEEDTQDKTRGYMGDIFNLNSDPFLDDSIDAYGKKPGMSQLEEALENMEKGEKRIRRFERINNSNIYKGLWTAYDSIAELLGRERDEDDIYKMLSDHQKDVFMVNYVVLSMTKVYESNLDMISQKLDHVNEKEAEVGSGRQDIDEEYKEAMDDYVDAKEKVETLDRREDPMGFKDARKGLRDAKSRLRRVSSDSRINAICDIGYKQSSSILEKQMDIFEELLYTVKDFGAKTSMYQHTLRDITSTCEATRDLAELGSTLSEGLKDLESIKSSILGQYKKDISSIIQIASNDEMGRKAIEENEDLSRMSASLTYASKKRSAEYEWQSNMMERF